MKNSIHVSLIILTAFLFAFNISPHLPKKKDIILLTNPTIKMELEFLVESENPDALVLIEVMETGKSVQFFGNKKEGVMFNLPTKQLNDEEFQKATALLETYKIYYSKSSSHEAIMNTDYGGPNGSFDKHIKKKVKLAIELASRIIIDVFGEGQDVDLVVSSY